MMKGSIISKAITMIFIITAVPIFVMAESKPVKNIQFSSDILPSIQVDTIPPVKRSSDEIPETGPIKEVPKSRRQSVPVPVVKVPPVKVIRPKVIKPKVIKPVIKPVIKILN